MSKRGRAGATIPSKRQRWVGDAEPFFSETTPLLPPDPVATEPVATETAPLLPPESGAEGTETWTEIDLNEPVFPETTGLRQRLGHRVRQGLRRRPVGTEPARVPPPVDAPGYAGFDSGDAGAIARIRETISNSTASLTESVRGRIMDLFSDRVARGRGYQPLSTSEPGGLDGERLIVPGELETAIASAASSVSASTANTLRNLKGAGVGIGAAGLVVFILDITDVLPPDVSSTLSNVLLAAGGLEAVAAGGVAAAAGGASAAGIVGGALLGLTEFAAGAAFIAVTIGAIFNPEGLTHTFNAIFNPDENGPDLNLSVEGDLHYPDGDFSESAQAYHEAERQRYNSALERKADITSTFSGGVATIDVSGGFEQVSDRDRMLRMRNKYNLIHRTNLQAANLETIANELGPKYINLVLGPKHHISRPVSVRRMGYEGGSIRDWLENPQVTGNGVFYVTTFVDLIKRVQEVFNEVMFAEVLRYSQEHNPKTFNVSELTPYQRNGAALCVEMLTAPDFRALTHHGDKWTLRVVDHMGYWVIMVDSDAYKLNMSATTLQSGRIEGNLHSRVHYHGTVAFRALRELVSENMLSTPKAIYFTGYAYGGAIASALSYWWEGRPPTRYGKLPAPTVITFGAPRYAGRNLAAFSTHRVLHHLYLGDSLPRAPPGYVHDGAVIRLFDNTYDIWHALPDHFERGRPRPLVDYKAAVMSRATGPRFTEPDAQWDLSDPDAWTKVVPLVSTAGSEHRDLSDVVIAGMSNDYGTLPKASLRNYWLGVEAYAFTTTEVVNGRAYTPKQVARQSHLQLD